MSWVVLAHLLPIFTSGLTVLAHFWPTYFRVKRVNSISIQLLNVRFKLIYFVLFSCPVRNCGS